MLKEERFQKNVYEIRRICQIFELTDYIMSEVERLYYKALLKGRTQGKSLTTTIAGLIYYICRREGYPLTMKDISQRLKENSKLLWRRYKQLRKELHLTKKNYDYTNLIYKYNQKIRLKQEELEKVRQTYEQMKHYYNDPRVKIAAAFYKVKKGTLSIRKISECTGVSQSAIQVLSNSYFNF